MGKQKIFSVDKQFDSLTDFDDKVKYIWQNPSAILKIDQKEVERVEKLPSSNAEHALLQMIKFTAIQQYGFLIFGFEGNGFKINKTIIHEAFKSAPSICAQCPEEWLDAKNIRLSLKDDVKNYVHIPSYWFNRETTESKNLVKYVQKQIRLQLKDNAEEYQKLPRQLVEGKYSAYTSINAYTTYGNEFRALVVPKKSIWERNGGKILFKIARKNINIALKMLNETQRVTLAKELVKQDYNSFESFPSSLKQNKKVRYKFYVELLQNGDYELMLKHFGKEEQDKCYLIYQANLKRAQTLAEKKQAKLLQELEQVK